MRDLIYGMKLRGQQKPPDLPQAHWDEVQVTVAQTLSNVAGEYRRKLVESAALKIPDKLPEDDKSKISTLYDLGVTTVLDVMTDPASKDSVRLQAATYIVDHTIGKAKQEIEHSGSLALEIRAQARKALALEAASMRDVSPQNVDDKTLSPVDAFLQKHMSDDFVVGKKASVDDESL